MELNAYKAETIEKLQAEVKEETRRKNEVQSMYTPMQEKFDEAKNLKKEFEKLPTSEFKNSVIASLEKLLKLEETCSTQFSTLSSSFVKSEEKKILFIDTFQNL